MVFINKPQVFPNNTFTISRPIYPDGSDRGWIGTQPKRELERWCYMLCTPIILYECIRTIPGEVRMYARMKRRGAIRPAEIMFLVLKYLALTTALLDALLNFAGNKWMGYHGERCKPISFVVNFGYYSLVCIVSGIVAFRCFVIYQGSRRVGCALLAGLSLLVASAMARAATEITFDRMFVGACAGGDALYENTLETYLFLCTCIAFDFFVTVAGCYKLMKWSVEPLKMHRVTALLFWNNVHYAAILMVLNIVQLGIYSGTQEVPSLAFLTAALSVVIGLQQLIKEQDAVNGYADYDSTDWRLTPPPGKQYPLSVVRTRTQSTAPESRV